jgi:hypothetical protein
MLKFAVIIPFRPKAESVNWENESALLHKTINSVLQQTYNAVNVFVIHNEEPVYTYDDRRVQYIQFPYGHQGYNEMENRDDLLSKFKSQKMVVRRWDKARKLCYGSKLAKEAGCDYVMALDADDMLSNKLFDYLAKDSQKEKRDGWYMEKGYVYLERTNFLIKVPKTMRFLNGSTHILHSSLVHIPDFSSLTWLDYSLFTDHGWIKDRVKEQQGARLYPIPFPGLVYVVHRSNISKIAQRAFGFSVKAIIKRIVRGRFLTNALRKEFNIK